MPDWRRDETERIGAKGKIKCCTTAGTELMEMYSRDSEVTFTPLTTNSLVSLKLQQAPRETCIIKLSAVGGVFCIV